MQFYLQKIARLNRPCAWCLALVLMLLCVLFRSHAEHHSLEESDRELRLSSAFVYNFAKFTTWPKKVFPHKTFNICVTTHNSKVMSAFMPMEKMKFMGQYISVRSIDHDYRGLCHVVYFPKSHCNSQDHNGLLVNHPYALSVSSEGYEGIVELFREGDRIRFKVDLVEARQQELKISSQLLKLAVEVTRD